MDQETFFQFAQVVSRFYTLEQELSQSLPKDSLSPLQRRFLQTLFVEGPQSLGTLAECLGLLQPNASREARKLTQAGLVEKTTLADNRRKTMLTLTPAGRVQVENQFSSMALRLGQIVNASPVGQEKLSEALKVLLTLKA